MTKNVFAGTWEIAAENGMNKSIARFPDVCMSPPSPPAGPIPIPYPDTSFSNNLKSGSKTVKIGGKGAALAQQSYYKQPVLGDEAATRAFGANVITHQITGKTYFQAWCMDVKFEDKNVCRHFDITTSNHASGGTTTTPLVSVEFASIADVQEFVDAGICPCCGDNLHAWQIDPATNRGYSAMTENDFWQTKINGISKPAKKAEMQATFDRLKAAKSQQRALAAAGKPSCPNVHKSDTDGCAVYFNSPGNTRYPSGKTVAQTSAANFNPGMKAQAKLKWEAATGKVYPAGEKFNHITPKMASGCNSVKNVVPDSEMPGSDCQAIESDQSKLENINQSVLPGI